jgi:hypothetical protein
MVGENKKTVFENWLAAYGSHLEQIAGTVLSGSGESRQLERVSQPETEEDQDH